MPPPNRQQLLPAALDSSVQRQNLLQNGGFEQWHYGVGPFTTGMAADQWTVFAAGTDTLSVTRDAVNIDTGSAVAAACAFVLGNGAGLTRFYASFAPPTVSGLIGRTMTFSARVRCNVANAVRLSADAQYAAADHFTYSAYHSGSGNYETLSVTLVVPANTNPLQFALSFSASCTAYIDNAMLDFGPQYRDFVPSIAYPDALPNERLASDVLRPNLLTNGGFEHWQRGNGPFTVGNGSYTADRWTMWQAGGISISRDTANVDRGGVACAAVTTTSGGGFIYQNFIAANNEGWQLRGRVVSFSARVKCNVPNACRLLLADATAGTNVYSAYHSGSGNYETLTITMSTPISAGCLNGQGQIVFDAAGTFYVDNAMVVVGSAAADYVPLHPADDLARCLRYYEGLFMTPVGGASDVLIGMNYSTTQAAFSWPFKVEKPVVPTVTLNGPGQAYLVVAPQAYVGVGANSASTSAVGRRAAGCTLVYGAILTNGQANQVSQNGSGFYWVAEANP